MREPPDDVDPADLAEQQAPLRADPDEDDPIVVDVSDLEVDDADRWEQATPVGRDDEDDYREG
jgi:hypothetical protein